MLQLSLLQWAISLSFVTGDAKDELFQSFMKMKDNIKDFGATPSMDGAFRTVFGPPPSYSIVDSAEVTVATAGNDTETNDSNTETPLQACFNEIAAENFPRMLAEMDKMKSEEIKEHPIYKAFYYTASRAGQKWRNFFDTIKALSPTQVRDSLKLVNSFSKLSKKGGMDDKDKMFLRDYQKDLFGDFQKLNSMNLTDTDKKELADHYKQKEPQFLKENEILQKRLENVMQKFSSFEIRNDKGLKNMAHVGVDPEQFVTLKRMVQDRLKDEEVLNKTVLDMMHANRGPEPKTYNTPTWDVPQMR